MDIPTQGETLDKTNYFATFALSLGVLKPKTLVEAEIKPSEPEQDNACEGKRKPVSPYLKRR